MKSEERLPDYITINLKAPLDTKEIGRMMAEEKEHRDNMLVRAVDENPLYFPFKPISNEQIELTSLKRKLRIWSSELKGKKQKKFNKFFNL